MFELVNIWEFFAGLGIFLFGLFLLEEGIKTLSGRTFKSLIRRYTATSLKSVLSGAFVTSVLQSSTATSLIVLAFTGAGVLSIQNAMGVILGSNLGTSITSWIVAGIGFKLNIEALSLPLIGIGGLGLIFLKNNKKGANLSRLMVGFGFLFMGLDYMISSTENLAGKIDVDNIPDYGLLAYFFTGFIISALIQSSSATIAIIMTTLFSGLIVFHSAAAMAIGATLGTTLTIIIASIGDSVIKKRVAYAHFVFNLATSILALILLYPLVFLILEVFGFGNNQIIGLALFHSTFIICGIILLFPFLSLISKLMYRLIPDKKFLLTKYIHTLTPEVTEAAIAGLKKEVGNLIKITIRFNLHLFRINEYIYFKNIPSKAHKNNLSDWENEYNNLKLLQAQIFIFASNVQNQELAGDEAEKINKLLEASRSAVFSAKALKDIRHDLKEFYVSESEFLNEAYEAFKDEMIKIYTQIDFIWNDLSDKEKINILVSQLDEIRNFNKEFTINATNTVNMKKIKEINISTLLSASRNLYVSIKHIIIALKEQKLNIKESKLVDSLIEEK